MMALARDLGGDAHAVRAAELAKCDLTTELVKEFTELQGVVGGLYARVQGEPEPVWQSIYDHYKPESMDDAIPRHRTAQIVALADKLDTLRGCFGVGMIPSGSRDPFALRRAAQGVVKILVEGRLELPLLNLIGDDAELQAFFEDRIRYYFREIRGFAYDEINATMAAGWSNLVDLEARLAARAEPARRRRISSRWPPAFKRIKQYPGPGQIHGRRRDRRKPARSGTGERSIRRVPADRGPAGRECHLAAAPQGRPVLR